MRCSDCQKFVSLEFGDPEDVSLDLDSDSHELDENGDLQLNVSMTCRIVRNCGECGQKLKEATLEAFEEITVDADELLKEHTHKTEGKHTWREGHGVDSIGETGVDQIEEGGGRYAKSYFGASVCYGVSCKCGETLYEGEISDKVAASGMDELV